MKKWLTLTLVIVALFSFSLTAFAAVPQASDMENYVGNPGMYVDQADDGIHVRLDAEEGGTFTTAWGYNCEQSLDGLTITLKNVMLDAANESGMCIAIGNYEGAYWGDRCLMFMLCSTKDDDSWVYASNGGQDDVLIQMTGSEIYGLSKGVDVTFSWKKKNDTTWSWTVNGKEFTFSDALVTKALDDPEFVFPSFGGWNAIANVDYTITYVGQESDREVPSTPDASTPDASTPDASTPDASTPDASTPDASTPDASTPDNSDNDSQNDADEGGLPIGILIAIIVVAVLLLAAIGFLVYLFVIKPKKSV